jgi:transposase
LYAERDEEKREEFRKIIEGIAPETLVYIDEAGVDNRLFREYGRARRGQKIDIPGKKRERISMIGALMGKKFLAPMTFTGGCNADVFNAWLEQVLLKEIPRGSTIVMDNAAFHKSTKTRELIENAGCFLLFLPPYSPDLNPIEQCWHQLKSMLRPLVQMALESLENLLSLCLLALILSPLVGNS